MRQFVTVAIFVLLVCVPGRLLAQNCCACSGTCKKAGCVDVSSIKGCIDYCKGQGPKCDATRYLQNSSCAMDCFKRAKTLKATHGGK